MAKNKNCSAIVWGRICVFVCVLFSSLCLSLPLSLCMCVYASRTFAFAREWEKEGSARAFQPPPLSFSHSHSRPLIHLISSHRPSRFNNNSWKAESQAKFNCLKKSIEITKYTPLTVLLHIHIHVCISFFFFNFRFSYCCFVLTVAVWKHNLQMVSIMLRKN